MNASNEINVLLGSRVKHIRNDKKLTREQLAERIDVSTRFLADVESGKVGVSLATLKRLCKVLSTTSDYLLGLSSYSEEEQRYIETDSRIKRIPTRQLENINMIIDAFENAINKENGSD